MKALKYMKNKWRFIIAFVICCFALSCHNYPSDIQVKLISFNRTFYLDCYRDITYIFYYEVVESNNKNYPEGSRIKEVWCLHAGDSERINYYKSKIGEIIIIGENSCGCRITRSLGLP